MGEKKEEVVTHAYDGGYHHLHTTEIRLLIPDHKMYNEKVTRYSMGLNKYTNVISPVSCICGTIAYRFIDSGR